VAGLGPCADTRGKVSALPQATRKTVNRRMQEWYSAPRLPLQDLSGEIGCHKPAPSLRLFAPRSSCIIAVTLTVPSIVVIGGRRVLTP
jgi:hypothetical protein